MFLGGESFLLSKWSGTGVEGTGETLKSQNLSVATNLMARTTSSAPDHQWGAGGTDRGCSIGLECRFPGCVKDVILWVISIWGVKDTGMGVVACQMQRGNSNSARSTASYRAWRDWYRRWARLSEYNEGWSGRHLLLLPKRDTRLWDSGLLEQVVHRGRLQKDQMRQRNYHEAWDLEDAQWHLSA